MEHFPPIGALLSISKGEMRAHRPKSVQFQPRSSKTWRGFAIFKGFALKIGGIFEGKTPKMEHFPPIGALLSISKGEMRAHRPKSVQFQPWNCKMGFAIFKWMALKIGGILRTKHSKWSIFCNRCTSEHQQRGNERTSEVS